MSTLQRVSEVSNLNEKVILAAQAIGRSKVKRAVFSEIYRGKNKHKTVAEIVARTGYTNVRVLQAGGQLADMGVIEQIKVKQRTAYKKDKQLAHKKQKILNAAGNKAAQDKIPTVRNPQGGKVVSIRLPPQQSIRAPKEITVDAINSFKKVRKVRTPSAALDPSNWKEQDIKAGLKRIIGETHEHKDWGGEKNDLFTNKLHVTSSRESAAFALKGRATQGTLTPRMMGVNGDQIERLLTSNATVFMVVYHGKVADSIYGQLQAFALGKSMSGRKISYGVIDGDDLNRLMQAYPGAFKATKRPSMKLKGKK